MRSNESEFQSKIRILRNLLEKYKVDAFLLRRISSFAWVTSGAASYVNTASSEGAASLLITADHLFLLTNNIEATRMEQEECLINQGWEFRISPWDNPLKELKYLISGLSLISDVPFPESIDISSEISRLRAHLFPPEQDRFKQLGILCAEAMSAAAQAVSPGMSEYQIAALLGGQAQLRGVQPIVNLIATDQRIYQFRHPLPTEKKLERYAMLVLSGRRWGLVCSITRLLHFGPIPGGLQHRIEATAQVNANYVANSRPGSSLSSILAQGQQAYFTMGFPDEWKNHHQGGIAGYEPREYLATPASNDLIEEGHVIAWNPSIAGAKMEDTFLVRSQFNEIMTPTPQWPVIRIKNSRTTR